MPTWLGIQLGLLVIWIVTALFLYRWKLWKATTTFDGTDILRGLFVFIIPVIWLLSSVVFGLAYLLFRMPHDNLYGPLIFMIVLPLSILFILTVFRFSVGKRKKKYENELNIKIRQCKEWVQKFPFVNNDMLEVKIYLSNDRPVGRLVIHHVTLKQAIQIEEHRNELPNDVHLVIIQDEDIDKNKLFH